MAAFSMSARVMNAPTAAGAIAVRNRPCARCPPRIVGHHVRDRKLMLRHHEVVQRAVSALFDADGRRAESGRNPSRRTCDNVGSAGPHPGLRHSGHRRPVIARISVFVTITCAPTIGRPAESLTVPRIAPRSTCACARPALAMSANIHTTDRSADSLINPGGARFIHPTAGSGRRAIGSRFYAPCQRPPPSPRLLYSFRTCASTTATSCRRRTRPLRRAAASASACSARTAPARRRRSRSAKDCSRPIPATSSCSACAGTTTSTSCASDSAFSFRRRSSPTS